MSILTRHWIFRNWLSWSQLGLLLSLLIIAGASVYLALQLAARREAVSSVLGRGQADYYASGVHMLRFSPQGVASMQLRADRLEHVPDREQLRLIQPKLWLSSQQSDSSAITDTQLSAREGLISDDGEKASLSGDVVIVRKTQDAPSLQIQSELALIDGASQRIELPQAVRIEQGAVWVRGFAMVLDQGEKTLRIGSKVQAFFPAARADSESPERPGR